jgi:nucleotide-binding universal stress UspA family protein
MHGTLVCAMTDDDDDNGAALETAIELSERLGLRLVLAYVRDGIPPLVDGDEGAASVTMSANREGAARRLARLAAEHDVVDRAEQRAATGDPPAVIGQIAAEEAADLILVGARTRGRLRRGLDSRLAGQLGSETPLPVLIAPPRSRSGRMAA